MHIYYTIDLSKLCFIFTNKFRSPYPAPKFNPGCSTGKVEATADGELTLLNYWLIVQNTL